VVGYYGWIALRYVFIDFGGSPTVLFPLPSIGMPPLSYLSSVVFWLFAGLSLLLLLPTMRPIRQADVDVLYPTPVDPRHVMLFRLVGDYLVTLFLPLILALIGLRPARMFFFDSFIKGFPHAASTTLRGAILGWLLLSAMFVCIHNAAALWSNRTGEQGEKIKRIITWSFRAAVLLLGLAIWIGAQHVQTWDDFAAFSAQPLFRCAFFGASAVTAMVMGPLQHSFVLSLEGYAVLIGVAALALASAFHQIGYLYDQSTVRADARSAIRSGAVKGDPTAFAVARAQQGKLKARVGGLSRFTITGPGCLVWKSLVIQSRSGQGNWIWLFIVIIYGAIIHMLGQESAAAGPLMLGLCGLTAFAVSTGSASMQSMAVLRRIDIHKPLPIAPVATIAMEALACTALPSAFCLIPIAVMVITTPSQWMWAVSAVIVLPSVVFLISTTVFVVTLLFPDIDDPAQRGIRGLISLLGLAIAISPGIGAMVLVGFLHWIPLGALLPAAINLAMALGLCLLGGQLYGNFNPTD